RDAIKGHARGPEFLHAGDDGLFALRLTVGLAAFTAARPYSHSLPCATKFEHANPHPGVRIERRSSDFSIAFHGLLRSREAFRLAHTPQSLPPSPASFTKWRHPHEQSD